VQLLAVVVGIDHWIDYTRPFIRGIRKHNSCFVSLVDNASKKRYPALADATLRLEKRVGYAEALNLGANCHKFDWMIAANNDCVCSERIPIETLDKNTVYGEDWKEDHGLTSIESGWLLIPRNVWDKVRFDENYDAAFEDFDYIERVKLAGFKIDVLGGCLKHLFAHTRREVPGYEERWHKSFALFKKEYVERN
jgi:hypothetical protein